MPQSESPRVAKTAHELALQIGGVAEGHIVAIDGFMGAGKSTLSFELAQLLNGFRVSLDSYVDRDLDVTDYVEKLRLAHLSRDLDNLVMRFPCLVIEGIRVLDVLQRAGHSPSTRVYVKRLSSLGIWHDGHHLENFEAGTDVPEGWLRRDELSYHSRRRPHLHAQIFYERTEA
jgi:hypothetical protein